MQDKLHLMIPGPTPVPEEVLQAIGRHPIGHRSGEFQEIVKHIKIQLQWLHQTQSDVFTITGSGTAAMEAGIVNTLSKGDTVVCGENGKFGERWVKVSKAFGLNVEVIKAEWGSPLDPDLFKKILQSDKNKKIKAVIITHSETSTGVINDLKTISKYVTEHGTAISIADCVTSLGACNVPMDEWGLDVVASGSQKGYMIPPGLSFIAMSPKAWKAQECSNLPKFYLDLKAYQKAETKNSNPFTPGVNLYFGLAKAFEMMQKEGLENIFKRHAKHQSAIQAGIKAIGLPLFAQEGYGSPSVTSVVSKNIDADLIRKRVKDKYDILLAGGQDHLKGKIFRIGHLGYVCDRDVIAAIAAIESTLATLELTTSRIGAGVEAASKILERNSFN